VLALYDYIVNAQKDLINPAKLKTDLYDVNKKVSEIEEMLQIGLADKKYSTLLGHFRQKGSMKSLANTDVGFYLEGKRREFRENINIALESRLLPGFNNRNKSILGHIKDTRSNSVK